MTTPPAVSVIIPTIGAGGDVFGARRVFVVEAVRSLLATAGVPVEVIAVTGPSMPEDVATTLGATTTEAGVPYRRLRIDGQFNFAASVNLGAANADGTHLLLLNDDVEALNEGWLAVMCEALEPGVGAVGAKLLFEDGTLQHAGHTYRTALDHIAFGQPGDTTGRTGILARRRDVAGVTAACMLTPADVFEAVGGMCTHLPGNYNDVDYCLKLRFAGWSVVYEPGAVLYHFESRSRAEGGGVGTDEVEFIRGRWATRLAGDEFTPLVP